MTVKLIEKFTELKDQEAIEQSWWHKHYAEIVEQMKSSSIDDVLLRRLWFTRENGVSRLMQGNLSDKQFSTNIEVLRELTSSIITNSDHQSYLRSVEKIDEMVQAGLLSFRCIALLNRAWAAAYPDFLTTTIQSNKFDYVYQRLNQKYQFELPESGDWYQKNTWLTEKLKDVLPDNYSILLRNMQVWHLYEEFEDANSTVKEPAPQAYKNKPAVVSPLNQILYGPPGTGKTYHTIEAAVRAAEPEEYATLGIDSKKGATEEQRNYLVEQYESFSKAGRIRFVTFHQSYGYEEFVEGLKANSEDGEISYDAEKGVFRQICDEAAKHTTDKAASKAHSFDLCWQVFSEQLAEKDSLEITMSQTSFRVMDFNAKRIFFEKSNGKKDHTLSINTLKDIFEGSRDYTSGLGVYYNPLVRYLKGLVAIEQQPAIKRQNYVLVIDEINRGNISKIFGELITLIEPSKRKGGEEEIELLLPCSGDKFSVPSNLHIIGTMNTADRSLAMMDTALRRRFDFVEMMPRADLFSDHCIEWHGQKIDLKSLLEALNKRIEVLYDREHTLGHAFLFPAYNAAKSGQHELAFDELKAAFKNKIIPLLEEYFYEDWNKIRLVLGDSLKQDETLQFLKIKKEKYSDLFGEFHGLELYEEDKITYQIKPFDCDDSIWNRAEAYIGIYSLNSVKD
ncbi:ATP-binding protein [Vibrio splendidus]|uniref:McrB family protein n=1 Tax=Vibrio splendidus TaxID=29497 RepID=UPI000D36A817|nr:AAA family ATPase [Vibrio splendidus]PTO89790.1 ATP-binding protein [Vibrio splendidus]PTP49493.1 ATP-binding protein [Vibrio splendidus]